MKTVSIVDQFIKLSTVEQDEVLRLFIIKLYTESTGMYNSTLQGPHLEKQMKAKAKFYFQNVANLMN